MKETFHLACKVNRKGLHDTTTALFEGTENLQTERAGGETIEQQMNNKRKTWFVDGSC